MDLRSAAQTIRDTVTMYQVLDLYGYKTKHGFMICPFHGDRDVCAQSDSGAARQGADVVRVRVARLVHQRHARRERGAHRR